uniref:ARAD1C41228p n=1 Tax=Blastobotrys adeninivorans TaxID=409370 RepID=A0A060T3P1_BLAAD
MVAPLHEAGRQTGDTIVSCTTSHVAVDLANGPKDPPNPDIEVMEPIIDSEAGPQGNGETTVIEDAAIQSRCIKKDDGEFDEPMTPTEYGEELRSLVVNVGSGRNELYCPDVNKLNEFVIEHTGYGAPKALLTKFENKGNVVGKEPDFSYYPYYLPVLRKMQGLRAFPRVIGEAHYSDSSSKGTMDCAIQIEGSDLQPYAVFGIDVNDPRKKKKRFDTVRLSKYDCSPEFLIHLTRNCSYDEETIDALKWAALLKAKRERADLHCFKKLVTVGVVNIHKIKELRKEFTILASEHWKNTKENVFRDRPHNVKDFLCDIGKLRRKYSCIPKLPEVVERNIQYHERMIDELMKSLEGKEEIDPGIRNLLTTRAIIENVNTYQIKQKGYEKLTIRKLGYGQSAQEFAIPLSAVFGFFFSENGEESIFLGRCRMQQIHDSLSVVPDLSTVVGPFKVRPEWICSEYFAKISASRYPKLSRDAAVKKYCDMHKDARRTLDLELPLSAFDWTAMKEVTGQVLNDSIAYKELLAYDSLETLRGYSSEDDPSSASEVGPSGKKRSRRGKGRRKRQKG